MDQETDLKKIQELLDRGIITPEEYTKLIKREQSASEFQQEPLVPAGKSVLSFILTIIATVFILFGTCVLNVGIVAATKSESLILFLGIVWILFPLILLGFIAKKTRNPGIKAALILMFILGVIVLSAVL